MSISMKDRVVYISGGSCMMARGTDGIFRGGGQRGTGRPEAGFAG